MGQQVSVRAATTLAGRFADSFGEPIDTPFPMLNRLSPSFTKVSEIPLGELTKIGLVKTLAESVKRWRKPFVMVKSLSMGGTIPKIVCFDFRAFPASARGRLTISPCVGQAGPTPFLTPTWD